MYSTYNHVALMPPAAPFNASLRPGGCQLIIRQQPSEALVTTEGKEKARKPVDPPPILELIVDQAMDPHQQFLQNPYLFVSVSLFKADKDEPHDAVGDRSLAGTLVSSLHRLKDVSNKDGGFFVFGDISVKVQGTFRLHFSLYEFQSSINEVQYLGSVSSQAFKVLLAKDFKGMEESTYLSRAFSDQGVRLRLRKEPRGLMNNKRGYSYDQPETALRPNGQSDKRLKTEVDDDKIATLPASNYNAAYTSPLGYNTPTWYGMPRPGFNNNTSSNMALQPTSFDTFPTPYSRPPTLYNNTSYQTPTYPTPTFQDTGYQNTPYQATDGTEY